MEHGKTLGETVQITVIENVEDQYTRALSHAMKSRKPLTLEDSLWITEESSKLTDIYYPEVVEKEGAPRDKQSRRKKRRSK